MKSSDRLSASQSDQGRYRLLVENITDYAIYMLETDGTIASWNAGAQRFKSYTGSEVIGRHFSLFYTEEDKAVGLPARALEIAEREGRFEQEGWRVRKDGSRFWANVIIDPIRDNGVLVGFAKITRDLTERKKSEDELRFSQEQFRLLVQGVTDYAIFMLDPAGIVSNWNAGAQHIKGYEPHEIVGKHFSTFYTVEDRAAKEPERALATALSKGRFAKEGLRVRKDGTRFWASVVIDPIRSPTGELIGFAKVTRDITERREKELELERTQEVLRQSQKMEAVGQLTGGVAHDFNNLLTIIQSSVDFLRRPNLTEERRLRYVNAISDTVARASKLTSQLLSFARRQALKPEPFDVGRQVEGVVDLLRPLVGGRVRIDLSVCDPACIALADVSQFETALLNLAVNARDAMNGEGVIRIEIAPADAIPAVRAHPEKAGKFVAISVIDNGIGIPADKLDQIFEPFFTTKEVGQGTGLGLSQVFGFAKQSDGDITVESTGGEGANFTIYLPTAVVTPESGKNAETGGGLDGGGRCVLVVEDNREVGEFSTALLQDMGFSTVWAADAREALQLLADGAGHIDLVFSDVIMPGMNGIELAHIIRKTHPGLPIVLTSGYSDVLAAEGSHGFDLVQKPYSIDTLAEALGRAIAPRRSA